MTRVDASGVIGPVIQRMVARRLGRAGYVLAAIFATGLVEFALVERPPETHLWTILGAVFGAAALLAIGMRAVRRGFGDPPHPWMTAASVAGFFVLLWALWLVGFRGLRGFAQVPPGPEWIWFGLWTGLGARVLFDISKVGELERLAGTMILPAPDERTMTDG